VSLAVWATRGHVWSSRDLISGSHKRFDPVYSDAKMRSKDIGDFSFFNSYMSQPKSQLQTFSAWAGVDSDISYYLNSHHVSLD
jgi:D-galacturonate reductase